jgi:hypothetical protein
MNYMNAQDKSTMTSIPGIAVRTGVKSGGAEPFMGEIALFPYQQAPKGWAYCTGQLLQIARSQPLFSLIGTMFGGDGETTFALPNLEGPGDGLRYAISLGGTYPSAT